jgi:hypothetical protein
MDKPVSTKIFMFMSPRTRASWKTKMPSRIITSAAFTCRDPYKNVLVKLVAQVIASSSSRFYSQNPFRQSKTLNGDVKKKEKDTLRTVSRDR